MSKPITDKAEVSIDFPDKLYMGSFGRESHFEVTADAEGVHIHLNRPGKERRHVGFHLHYYLLAGVIEAMGEAIGPVSGLPEHQRQRLKEAAQALAKQCGS
jgi:hypothetical protein